MQITRRLFELRDESYAAFHAGLIPTVDSRTLIGVRIPALRALAKSYRKEEEAVLFLQTLPHDYYDENMLHALLVAGERDYDICVKAVDDFLPYVDNWAVCDSLNPKAFNRHHEALITDIRRWIASQETYTCRFGIGMLMTHFLDADFRSEYLELPASVHSEEYYVNMMSAWFYATALAKQWQATIPYLEEQRLDKWVHNKTIQKSRESFRITPAQKEYLKTLRR